MAGPNGWDFTYLAEVDLSSSQYRAIVHSDSVDRQIKLPVLVELVRSLVSYRTAPY